MRGLFFNLTPVGALVGSAHAFTILEGKAKGPRSGETTNESYDATSALAHLGPTYQPTTNDQQGSVSRTVGVLIGIIVG